MTAKLVIACDSEGSAAARAVAGSPLGRGRVALLSADRQVLAVALIMTDDPGSCHV